MEMFPNSSDNSSENHRKSYKYPTFHSSSHSPLEQKYDKMGVPQIIQSSWTMTTGIETYGDLGIPNDLRNPNIILKRFINVYC